MSPTHGRAGAIMPRYVAPTGGTSYNSVISALSPLLRWKLDDTSAGSGAAAEVVGGHNGDIGDSTVATVNQTGLVTDGGKAIKTLNPGTSVLNPITLPSTSGVLLSGTGGLLTGQANGSFNMWYQFIASGTDVLVRDNSTAGGSLLNLTSSPTWRWAGVDHTLAGTLASWKTAGQKHMFTFTMNGNTGKVYLDGALNTTFTQTSAPFSSWGGGYILLGKNGGVANQYVSAYYDEVAFFTSVLADADVLSLYNAGK